MRKHYKLKEPLKREGKTMAKPGAAVPLTRAQFEALHAQGLISGPVDAADAWPEPRAKKASAGA